jgi:ComF family protein
MAGLVPRAALPDKARMRGLVALRSAAATILGVALPPRCPGCDAVVAADHRFCLRCWSTLDFLAGPACSRCAEPFSEPLEGECANCLADRPAFDRVRAAVLYGAVAQRVAVRLKHGNRPGTAQTMAQAMIRLLEHAPPGAVLVPVPLHRWRLWRRGYNQAALVARALSRLGRIDCELGLLRRHRSTPMLRALDRHRRAKAVAGAISAEPGARARLAGRPVLLIDDVLTTGATARACAKVLTRIGAPSVEVWCWARVPPDRDQGNERSLGASIALTEV